MISLDNHIETHDGQVALLSIPMIKVVSSDPGVTAYFDIIITCKQPTNSLSDAKKS